MSKSQIVDLVVAVQVFVVFLVQLLEDLGNFVHYLQILLLVKEMIVQLEFFVPFVAMDIVDSGVSHWEMVEVLMYEEVFVVIDLVHDSKSWEEEQKAGLKRENKVKMEKQKVPWVSVEEFLEEVDFEKFVGVVDFVVGYFEMINFV